MIHLLLLAAVAGSAVADPPEPAAPAMTSPQPPAPSPQPADTARLARALRSLPPGPSLRQAIAAALAQSSISDRPARSAIKRARLAALLPSVDVTLDTGADRQYRLDQAPGVEDNLTTDAEATRGVRVRASWDLHRLLFDPDELRATRAVLDVLDHQAAVTERITTLYAQRRALLVEQALADPRTESPATAIARMVSLTTVEGLLEAATGLRFSRPGAPVP